MKHLAPHTLYLDTYLDIKPGVLQEVVQRILARLHDSLAYVHRKPLQLNVEIVTLYRLSLAKFFQCLSCKAQMSN